MRLLPRSAPTRFAVCAGLAIVVPAAFLAVLGYVSLRQWQASADLLFREQSRNMAVMAAEKVDMTLRHLEDDALAHLETVLASHGPDPAALGRFLVETPLVARLALFERAGRALYPPGAPSFPPWATGSPLNDAAPALWDRGGRRHVIVADDLVVATVLRAAGRPPTLVVIAFDPRVLRREAIEKPLAAPDGSAGLAVTDHRSRPVYGPDPARPADVIAAVPLGELLPAWRLALVQPAGRAPGVAVHRQMMLFTSALGLLLVVIVAGLAVTYRLVRHETEMARLKADFVANVSHDLKTPVSLIRVFAETLEMRRVTDDAT